jgi:esterase/lipase
MRFQTIGNPDGCTALLIHAMCVSSESFSILTEYLKEDYFMIIPTLDGHDVNESSDFVSIEDEGGKILSYLQKNNIKELDFVAGTSLGAIIGFEVYRRNVVTINKLFLDGGPFFRFGPLFQKIVSKQLLDICNEARQNPEIAAEKLNKLFPGLGNLMAKVCAHMTDESVRNLAHACYTFQLPKLNETAQKPVTFLYGTKEPASKCIFRLKRYKHSHIIKKVGYNHCGYLLSHPKEYAEMLKGK